MKALAVAVLVSVVGESRGFTLFARVLEQDQEGHVAQRIAPTRFMQALWWRALQRNLYFKYVRSPVRSDG